MNNPVACHTAAYTLTCTQAWRNIVKFYEYLILKIVYIK